MTAYHFQISHTTGMTHFLDTDDRIVERKLWSASSAQMSFNKMSTNSVKLTSVQNMRPILQAIKRFASNMRKGRGAKASLADCATSNWVNMPEEWARLCFTVLLPKRSTMSSCACHSRLSVRSSVCLWWLNSLDLCKIFMIFSANSVAGRNSSIKRAGEKKHAVSTWFVTELWSFCRTMFR